MPAIVRRLSPRGLEKVDYAASSLAEAVAFEPFDGVYTVGNTWQCTKTLLFDAHLDRLEASARYQRIPLDYDRQQLKAALRAMILASDFGDVRFRISIPTSRPDSLLISLEPYDPPDDALVRQGVRCVTSGVEQRKGPSAKTSDWMHIRAKLQDAIAPGIYEIILLDESGFMLEGASSNFYAIVDGRLYTAGSGILAGISRRIVLEVCREILPLRLQAPHIDDLPGLHEAFLTSSSRGLIPIVEIDGRPIGDGAVGGNSLELRRAYERWVAEHLEEL
ncbi:MAG: aminotransferase class IV [Chloroflexi bacterium]|nr:aminotransferase class IV [Chloroflexota bacterium]